MISNTLEKYLARYAEPESLAIKNAPLPLKGIEHILVVPACDEADHLPRLLSSVSANRSNVLVILVVNAVERAASSVLDGNQKILDGLRSKYVVVKHEHIPSPQNELFQTPWGYLWCMDRTSFGRRLDDHEGVGTARKMGADVALKLIAMGGLNIRWIHNTDADVQLPQDYFQQTMSVSRASLAVYDFRHDPSEDHTISVATQRVEQSLHTYIAGLARAGSPYAFATIGSAFAIDTEAYAAVRGFPHRTAAEDFYIANKLAKVGPVISLNGAPLRIASRRSNRVPFGTGPAAQQIAQLHDTTESLAAYAYPQLCFSSLKIFLETWTIGLESGLSSTQIVAQLQHGARRSDFLVDAVGSVSERLVHAMRLTESSSSRVRLKAFHDWFDALRTYQFIRRIRSAVYKRSNSSI